MDRHISCKKVYTSQKDGLRNEGYEVDICGTGKDVTDCLMTLCEKICEDFYQTKDIQEKHIVSFMAMIGVKICARKKATSSVTTMGNLEKIMEEITKNGTDGK